MDTSTWGEFRLGDLFEIKKGKRLTSEDQTEGTTPYIGAIDSNNGVANHIGQKPLHTGNTISLTYNGSVGEAFYQPDPFWATDDVNVLYLKPEQGVLNEKKAHFICTLLKQERYRYSYGRKWVLQSMKDTVLKLPLTAEKKPDWEYMESFIEHLDTSLPKTANNPGSAGALNTANWKEFKVGELFAPPYKALAHKKSDFVPTPALAQDAVPYVSRTERDNAVDMFVAGAADIDGIEEGNAIVIGDTTATVTYQPRRFVCGDHIVVLRAPWLDQLTGLFVVSILKAERFRYSYGRAFTMSAISDTVIRLPATPQGEPDWDYMAAYIAKLPYGDLIGQGR